jgi:hypothetical protein
MNCHSCIQNRPTKTVCQGKAVDLFKSNSPNCNQNSQGFFHAKLSRNFDLCKLGHRVNSTDALCSNNIDRYQEIAEIIYLQ